MPCGRVELSSRLPTLTRSRAARPASAPGPNSFISGAYGRLRPARPAYGRPCSSRTPPCASETRTDSAGRRVHFPSCRGRISRVAPESCASRAAGDGRDPEALREDRFGVQTSGSTRGTGQAGCRWRGAGGKHRGCVGGRRPFPVDRRALWTRRLAGNGERSTVNGRDAVRYISLSGGRISTSIGSLPGPVASVVFGATSAGIDAAGALRARRLLLPPPVVRARAAFRAGAAFRAAVLRAGALRRGGLSSRRLPRCSLTGGLLGGLLRRALPCCLARGALARSCLLCAAPPSRFAAGLPGLRHVVTPFRSARQPWASTGAAPSKRRVACTPVRVPCDLRRIVAQVAHRATRYVSPCRRRNPTRPGAVAAARR